MSVSASSDSRKYAQQIARRERKRRNRARLRRSISLYALLIPGVLLIFLFKYTPMYGLVIGFKKYNIFLGSNPFDAIAKSPWVGMQNWTNLWQQSQFRQVIVNTLVISAIKIIIGFPVPILLALMINEVRQTALKRSLQTIMYLPHFMSWVVVGALFMNILSTTGIVNRTIIALGGESQRFFMDNNWFRWILLFTSVWKGAGWNTIVYLAAITGIDEQLYEAARMDRANRLQQIWHITLPGIASTVVVMLILRLGSLMDAGFSQVIVMYNPTVYASGDIIDTYVYREGLGKMNWSTSTLVGMFNSVVNMVLVLGSNALSRKFTERSIW
jgi:putative aldouronate transport system permease protein